jgi:DNA-directed RNA polymerase subunit alpha
MAKTLSVFVSPIDDLGLSKRVCNSLNNENIVYIGDLIGRSPIEVRRIPNIGNIAFQQIQNALEINGWVLGTAIPGYLDLHKATFGRN